jgi:peptidase E
MIPMARLLLISNSTLHGGGYLDHVPAEIRNFVKAPATLAFVPFALYDRRQYASHARERFAQMAAAALVYEQANESGFDRTVEFAL